jgi:two-component system nitrogen regulation response regulator GlnG
MQADSTHWTVLGELSPVGQLSGIEAIQMDRIMIVDGDRHMRRKLERLLMDAGYRVGRAESGEMLLEKMKAEPFNLVIMEANLPGISGQEALARLRENNQHCPVILMAEAAGTDDVIKASKLGAFDYVLKPVTDRQMLNIVSSALETGRITRLPINLSQDENGDAGDTFIGRSPPMQAIYKAIGRVAPTDTTVLIRGESGTGKELVARAIYQHSKRVNRPFVIVNCVAIPETLLESELFGHEKGAFTDARQQRIGKIEYAHRGTLFLDEIGDISLSVQAKLLRLLQEKSIERIGGKGPIHTDVRIIAATNADLEAKIKTGRLREDLYYRINVVSLNLPRLNERREDIPLLADYFMAKFAKNLGVRIPGILPAAKEALQRYDWPGNVRELANTIEKCLIFSKGCPVGAEDVADLAGGIKSALPDVPDDIETAIKRWVRIHLSSGKPNLLADLTDDVTRLIIVETLAACSGNRSQTARRLGITRPTLLYKMAKLGLENTAKPDSDK